jgi:hypothetical protein
MHLLQGWRMHGSIKQCHVLQLSCLWPRLSLPCVAAAMGELHVCT